MKRKPLSEKESKILTHAQLLGLGTKEMTRIANRLRAAENEQRAIRYVHSITSDISWKDLRPNTDSCFEYWHIYCDTSDLSGTYKCTTGRNSLRSLCDIKLFSENQEIDSKTKRIGLEYYFPSFILKRHCPEQSWLLLSAIVDYRRKVLHK